MIERHSIDSVSNSDRSSHEKYDREIGRSKHDDASSTVHGKRKQG
jgi:hypothetical protein